MQLPKSHLKIPFHTRKKTSFIFVHCADTPSHMDIGFKEIHSWHVKDNGWSAIGYHFVIRRNGTIEAGRPLDAVGAHVSGRNSDSVGVCMVGGKGPFSGLEPQKLFTREQLESLKGLLKVLQEQTYPGAEVLGHRDADKGKQCPSFDVRTWWKGVTDA